MEGQVTDTAVVTLGTATTAVVMRLTRSSTLEVMRQDYIRTARGNGLDHEIL
jgi:ABC-type dipeptide/oligopeptide/nickel transport system permease component